MNLERRLVDAVAGVGPWLAPLPTAYLVGRATVVHLAWPEPVGAVAAAIIEGLGLSSAATALTLWEYNRAKRKADAAAPSALAVGLVGVYFVAAVALTVLLDTMPALAVYAPALFPVLSLCGMGVLALRADHRRRLEAVEAERARLREERRLRKAESTALTHVVLPDPGRNGNGHDGTRDRARAILAERPSVTGSEVGRMLGVSDRRGRKLLELLREENGLG